MATANDDINLAQAAPVTTAPLQRHVFVCTGKSCQANNSQAVLETFWAQLAERGLLYGKRGQMDGTVIVTTCGSIGLCQCGPAVLVYPDGVWYYNVQPDDVAEIADSHLVNNQPVQRLLARHLPLPV
ncbi:MAG: (2Fe-2S) ferredoxin domain-containing protein [Cyanobacteria bacterium HKST-UBA06]|nr:(2Fe-2S) ferredoxin domain-containing protein [Cyanobacteria bacterium HKST-UBA04]MCA9807572.1 (2Fe-2S) ferredoxin domain-containing protein [Cyanobacteria bacterium HKST-UBA06]MCA9840525.1 (2Fe-2S) ferredoxin domain-containing protein [Cyanobacteria bacterium HKST-UBA03]